MPKKREDLTGKKFNKMTVLHYDKHDDQGCIKWICECECGNIKSVRGAELKNNRTTSCGCNQKEWIGNLKRTHGNSQKRLHKIWRGIVDRCNNKESKSFKNYGARGITISEYFTEYKNFESWALNNGYDKNLEIDRIENELGYTPGNCHWIKKPENSGVGKRRSLRNKTGCIGVRKTKASTFEAQITVNKKLIKLGTYKKLNEAIKARLEAEIKYFGKHMQIIKEVKNGTC